MRSHWRFWEERNITKFMFQKDCAVCYREEWLCLGQHWNREPMRRVWVIQAREGVTRFKQWGGEEPVEPMGTGEPWTSILSTKTLCDWGPGTRVPRFKSYLDLLLTIILDKLCTLSKFHLLHLESGNNNNFFKGCYDV